MAPLDEKWFGNPRDLVVAEALELEAASLGYPVQGMLGKNGWDGTLWSVLDWNFRVIMRMCTEGRLSCVVCSRVSQPRFKPASCGRKPGKTSRSPSRSRSQLSLTLPAWTMASEYLGGECVKIVCSKDDLAGLGTGFFYILNASFFCVLFLVFGDL